MANQEGRIELALAALHTNQISRVSTAAALFAVPRTTLRRRLQGSLPQATRNRQKRKLDPVEEQSLVQWILEANWVDARNLLSGGTSRRMDGRLC